MAVKCNITSLALENLNQLNYGFSCTDVTCKIAENYMEYLNCPIDYQPCKDTSCEAINKLIICSLEGANLTVSNITINSATVTFVKPSPHPYTVVLLKDSQVVLTLDNPNSPIQLTALSSDTAYTVRLTLHCPYGEERVTEAPFNTLIACVNILGFMGIAEAI